MQTYLGNEESTAIQLVLSDLPQGTPYTVVNHGQDNLVVLAANNVYRFPRSETVWNRSRLEREVLKTLREHPELPVPFLKHVYEDPAYTVAVARDGDVLENEDIRALAPEIQQKIGKQIGKFAYSFHQLFDPTIIRPLLSQQNPQAWYASYLNQILTHADEKYQALASWVLNEWPKHDHAESTVIHDDLHAHNILFNTEYNLSGVIDFGDVNLGNPEQDLRYVYWMSDAVFDEAVKIYEKMSQKPLDRELIKLCAISQELSGLCDPKRSYMHERAKQNLAYRSQDLIVKS